MYIRRHKEAWLFFFILYIDGILLIRNDVRLLLSVKMKDLGETQNIHGIKVLRDHKNKKITLS